MFIQGFIKARRSTCQGFTNSFSSSPSSSPSSSSSSSSSSSYYYYYYYYYYWTINLKNVAVKAIFTASTRVVRSKGSAVQKQPRNYLTRNKEESFFSAFTQYLSRQATKSWQFTLTSFTQKLTDTFNCNSACLWAKLCEANITSRVGKINDYELLF